MKWNDESHLDVVELLATKNGWIDSEEMLSEMFDEQIAPGIIERFGVKGRAWTDNVMMIEAFNDWSDSLCKDGEIHSVQNEQYYYMGEYS